jgi:type II secretory pathway pseudopilin PulG
MNRRTAFTLVELVVVLSILVAMAGILTPLLSGTVDRANQTVTIRSLTVVRDALQEYWNDTKFIELDGITTVGTEADRFSVIWLFRNPVTDDRAFDFDTATQIGWRGPYLSTSTGDHVALGNPALIDAWNQLLTIQDVDPLSTVRDLRIVSAGPNRMIDMPASTPTAGLTSTDVGDDLYVALTLR